MTNWNATILGPASSGYENRIYSLRLVCDEKYPQVPPQIWFLTQINLPCVDARDGRVLPSQFPPLAHWSSEYTMESLLSELRRTMAQPANRKLAQPPEGSSYV